MQDIKKYSKALQKIIPHKRIKHTHIMVKNDFKKFAGFTEKEIWGEFDDFSKYEQWLKEHDIGSN